MIIDTSALIAILRDEPEAASFAGAIATAATRRMSVASFLEAAIVIDGSRDPVASRRFDELVEAARIVLEPVSASRPESPATRTGTLVGGAGIQRA